MIIVKVEEAGTFNFPEFCYLMNRAVREDAEVGSGGSRGSLGSESSLGSGGSGGSGVLRGFSRVQNTHHKFMRASYMKHFAKFLAILHHNASFFKFCFIINFGFIKNLLHILEILKYYC